MSDKKKILVVDDDNGVGMMMKFNLETTHQYEVHTENDPSHVLEAALVFKPDLIFLDMIMPGMEGSELARQIEDHPSLKGTPIVFLSGMMSESEAHLVSLKGPHPYLSKPIGYDHLMECAQKYIA